MVQHHEADISARRSLYGVAVLLHDEGDVRQVLGNGFQTQHLGIPQKVSSSHES